MCYTVQYTVLYSYCTGKCMFYASQNKCASYMRLCFDIHQFLTFFYALVPQQIKVQGIAITANYQCGLITLLSSLADFLQMFWVALKCAAVLQHFPEQIGHSYVSVKDLILTPWIITEFCPIPNYTLLKTFVCLNILYHLFIGYPVPCTRLYLKSKVIY